jgi:hypothetical protein
MLKWNLDLKGKTGCKKAGANAFAWTVLSV